MSVAQPSGGTYQPPERETLYMYKVLRRPDNKPIPRWVPMEDSPTWCCVYFESCAAEMAKTVSKEGVINNSSERLLSYKEAAATSRQQDKTYLIHLTIKHMTMTTDRTSILLVAFVARLGDDRLLKTALLGELEGGTGYSGGQEFDWERRLQEDLKAFAIDTKGRGLVASAERMAEWYMAR